MKESTLSIQLYVDDVARHPYVIFWFFCVFFSILTNFLVFFYIFSSILPILSRVDMCVGNLPTLCCVHGEEGELNRGKRQAVQGKQEERI
jgi:hypothetical protein